MCGQIGPGEATALCALRLARLDQEIWAVEVLSYEKEELEISTKNRNMSIYQNLHMLLQAHCRLSEPTRELRFRMTFLRL